jgi:hydrogenase/urease accessory protein HupE
MRKLFTILLLLLLVSGTAIADEIRPAYLELTTTDGITYSVKWKVPMKGDMVLSLKPELPDACTERTPPSSMATGGAMITRWSISCTTGIDEGHIRIKGLENTMTDVLVRVVGKDGITQMVRLTPTETGFDVAAETTSLDVIRVYTGLGIEHILLGVDHLLFVFALLLIVNGWRRLVGTITAFTLAHSITLFAATLGWVHVAQAPVEAVIALSILFLATEIIHNRQGKPGIAKRFPWLVAFIFGLLHGFGFAGALAEIGLPEQSIPLALLFFNVGVELGQLLFVVTVISAGWVLRKLVAERVLQGSEVAASYLIGSLSAFWVIERTYSFWL